jgi:DNA-binding CsgD family transcriptional regulator
MKISTQQPMLVTLEDGEVVRANSAAMKQFKNCIGRSCNEVVGMKGACQQGCAQALAADPTACTERVGVVQDKVLLLRCTTVGKGVVVMVAGELEKLTPREAEVAALVVAGQTMEESANTLGISVTTIKTHLDNVRRKLGCRNLRELSLRLLR